MKVMSIFGTRPEIIRLSRIFALLDKNFDHIMVNTSQNYTKELNFNFFDDLKIRKPNYDLKVKTEAYGKEVAEIIIKTEDLLKKEKPDILLILGDTNSGLSAIPAAHQGIQIAHLEAGMRSYDFRMPEEKNRVIIDHLSTVLLPYTKYSRENLIRKNIHFLVTAHRSENVDNPKSLQNIFSGLEHIYNHFKKPIVYPIHPRTESKLKNIKIPNGVKLVKPLGFFDFSKLEKNAFCLITDSGTVPEEALYFKKPCVTIRDSTERPETIEAGSNILSGLNPQNILKSVETITSIKPDWKWDEALGDGKTASKIVNIIRGKLY